MLSKDIDPKWFDFIKIRPYYKEFWLLNNPNTNQIMYKVIHKNGNSGMLNITSKFWKNHEDMGNYFSNT